ncbi:MAG TPA: glycosyltransferase family 9 protein [Gemmatimonadaceae bacterium]|nr:glycosyltransferase family 9 protein [Gemmatimonadaceae bacterium]
MSGSPASPLRGAYLVQNPAWRAWLRTADAALALRAGSREPPPIPTPRRLLVAIGGHLGDAVIASSAIGLLRRALPHTELGVLVGSWSRPVLEGHPALRHLHTADHWKLARGGAPLAERVRRWRASRDAAVAEIRGVGYDAAVDLSAYYPNMAGLLYGAGIPARIGWSSGGYAPLYTHALPWTYVAAHTAAQHAALLRTIGSGVVDSALAAAPLAYDLPPIGADAAERARRVLDQAGLVATSYVVVHAGVGHARKAWPAERWRAVVEALGEEGRAVVLTGAGEDERRGAAALARGVTGCVDVTGRLAWEELRAVVADATLVLSGDTVTAHLAAAARVPVVVVMAAMSDPRHWRPLGDAVDVLTSAVPCAPCFRSRGCATMACVREVLASTVLAAARARLAEGAR